MLLLSDPIPWQTHEAKGFLKDVRIPLQSKHAQFDLLTKPIIPNDKSPGELKSFPPETAYESYSRTPWRDTPRDRGTAPSDDEGDGPGSTCILREFEQMLQEDQTSRQSPSVTYFPNTGTC